MHPYIAGLGDDSETLALIEQRTAEIIQRQKDEESRRKWTLLFTIGGALFAAVRLGIIVMPHIRRRSPSAHAPATNPRARRG